MCVLVANKCDCLDPASRTPQERLVRWYLRNHAHNFPLPPLVPPLLPPLVPPLVPSFFTLAFHTKSSTEEGQEMARKHGIEYFEVSALTGEGIEECYRGAAAQVIAALTNDGTRAAQTPIRLGGGGRVRAGCVRVWGGSSRSPTTANLLRRHQSSCPSGLPVATSPPHRHHHHHRHRLGPVSCPPPQHIRPPHSTHIFTHARRGKRAAATARLQYGVQG